MKIRMLFALLFLTAALTGCFEKKGTDDQPALPEQPSKVLDYLALSAHSLISQQQPDGFFKYEYDFVAGAYTPWDNVIHQARAGFALMQYYTFLINAGIDPRNAAIVLESVRKALKGYESASVTHNSMPGKLLSFYYSKGGIGKNGTQDKLQRLEAEIAASSFALTTALYHWNMTNSNEFESIRREWRDAMLYHARKALATPLEKRPFMAPLWLALTVYNQTDPTDGEVAKTLKSVTTYFTRSPRPMKNAEDYSWDMMAAHLQSSDSLPIQSFAARQTLTVTETLYAGHDTDVNGCLLSLGLAEGAQTIKPDASPDLRRIRQAALGRGQLEYYNFLKYTILPNQTWISLGPGRTLHSQDFKRFTGASLFGVHMPRTNIGLTGLCLLAGMRFATEDLKEIRQKSEPAH